MRILQFDLFAYGPFTGASLDFSRGHHGLHLVYGPNEAGKSSALRALGDALYGIPTQTQDAFLHAYASLRLGAALWEDGRVLEFIRRKARVQSLRLPDDSTPLDEARLGAFLHGVDRATFETMFGIGHETLVRGGRELAAGKGEVGRMLFAAGAGIADVRALQADLQKRAQDLFKSGGSVPVINRLLSDTREARANLRQQQLSVNAWQEHVKNIGRVRDEIRALESEASDVRRDQEHAKRILAALPTIAERKTCMAKWDAVRDAVLLRAGFRDDLFGTHKALESAAGEESEARKQLEEIAAAIDALRIPERILAAAETIDRLQQQRAAVDKSAKDCIRRQAELSQYRQDAEAILKRLPRPVPLENAREIEPGVAATAEIRELIAQHPAMQKAVTAANERLAVLSDQVENEEAGLRSRGEVPDTAGLERVIRRAQQLGAPEQKRADAVSAIRKLATQIESELRTMRLWSGTPEALEQLPAPSFETIERFQSLFERAESQLERETGKLTEAEAELRKVDAELDAFGRSYDVPTLEDLTASRGTRDLGWAAVKRAWREGLAESPEQAEFFSKLGGGEDLAAAYEASVANADSVADRLRIAADQVQRKAALVTRRETAGKDRACFEAHAAALRQETQRLQAEWFEHWKAADISPLTPREMLAWERRRQAVADRIRQWKDQTAELEGMETKNAELRSDLAGSMAALGEPVLEEPFRVVFERAEGILKRFDTAEARRQQSMDTLAQLKRQSERASKQRVEAADAMSAWRTRWASAIGQIGLGPDCTVSQAGTVLDAVRELASKLDEADRLGDRIAKMEQDADDFADAVRQLASGLHPELAALPPDRAIASLYETCQKARADRQELKAHLDRQKAETKRLNKAQATLREADRKLAALCTEAACENREELWNRVERSNARAGLESKMAELEQRLLLVAGGRTVPEFLAEVEAADADSLPGRLDAIERRLAGLADGRDRLNEQLVQLRQEESRMAGGADAARLLEDVAALQATLGGKVTEYMKLRAASFVLRRAIERYREKNQGPVLSRAGILFSALTAGSFERLQSDLNEAGEPVLTGIRGQGKAPVQVEAMSDGTRDQLYLALRIASLEKYLDDHPPAPFIVDDVLVNFDDERAVASLKALAELSARTQVIFFTHHEHLVRLAERNLDAAVLFRAQLGVRNI